MINAYIMGLFREIHASSKFEKNLNAIFIVPIPTKIGAMDLKDFCPISLERIFYKIIS